MPGASGCPIFPKTNIWNRRVDTLPVRSDSDALIASIGLGSGLHPDFGSYSGYGIPYSIANHLTPKKTVTFRYKSESDKGPYPIPKKVKREAGSDHHILIVDKDACKLYELFAASKSASGHWSAGSGAIWNLRLNRLRPDGWTSADAAGLPILPGLARYDEVAAGSSPMPSGSPHRRPGRPTSIRPATMPATAATRPSRRWASGSDSRHRST